MVAGRGGVRPSSLFDGMDRCVSPIECPGARYSDLVTAAVVGGGGCFRVEATGGGGGGDGAGAPSSRRREHAVSGSIRESVADGADAGTTAGT